ncbi:aldo/keto reductase [Deinococcus roseus]|uniref:2,5-diketo-D-gluconic acid reductase n=1 Tax=Deinococcus roseus TaxID=392414 RepID=A0ABQ2DHI3_9DEIO|nr:aldo/keto reductase [Deinococcus roseus]GGJ57503.1 2,5-diketo-D-gluconic acid reductase [Deinococcus roseus]
MEYIKLNNGVEMPKLGLGVFQMNDEQVRAAVPAALESGYRLIDTASRYYNEKAVGAALAEAGVPREELFITTKLWFKDHGPTQTREAFQVSLDNLGLDYLDLYLIHQPFGDFYRAWEALEALLDEGRIRAIGVSNFFADRYFDLVTHHRTVPAVNQLETHPLNQQMATQALMHQHGTVLQAWSPLAQAHQDVFNHPTLIRIAQAHSKTVAQVILRWLIQRDIPVVVKSTQPERLRENIDVFDFQLTQDEMQAILAVDRQQVLAGFTHQDPRMLELLLTLG